MKRAALLRVLPMKTARIEKRERGMQPFVPSKKVGLEENTEARNRLGNRSFFFVTDSGPIFPLNAAIAPGTQLDSTWIISELSALPPSLPSYKSLDSISHFLLVQNFHR